jgi:hypothetical protein
MLAVVEPHLNADAASLGDREQVVVHGEALRLRLRRLLQPLRAGPVEVAPGSRSDVARDAGAAPAEVVGRGDVGQDVEALDVAQVGARLDEPSRVDDERRLAVCLPRLDEAGNALVGQLATPRIS